MLLGGVSDHMPGRLPQQIRDSPSYYDHGIYAHVADIFASHDLHYWPQSQIGRPLLLIEQIKVMNSKN